MLANLLLFPSIILTSVFSKPPFMIFLQDEKPSINHRISTESADLSMPEINTVKNVKNLLKRLKMHFVFMNTTFITQ